MSRKFVLTLDSINQNVLNENNLNEIEMVTAKLSNVHTNIILKVHQMNKVSQQRSLYELGKNYSEIKIQTIVYQDMRVWKLIRSHCVMFLSEFRNRPI
jgi:anion-transporting  ArsA/GET3 family ATPase